MFKTSVEEVSKFCRDLWSLYVKNCLTLLNIFKIVHDGCLYHTETSPLIYRENEWTDFYMIGTPVMKELKNFEYCVSEKQFNHQLSLISGVRIQSFMEISVIST